MGWYSAEVKQKLEVVRLWCRLRNLPHNRTVSHIHKYYCTKPKSWEKSAMNMFNSIGISDILSVNKPRKGVCLKQAKQKLQDQDKVKWLLSLNSNGTNVNGNKLRTYREYKTNFKPEYYVKCNYE